MEFESLLQDVDAEAVVDSIYLVRANLEKASPVHTYKEVLPLAVERHVMVQLLRKGILPGPIPDTNFGLDENSWEGLQSTLLGLGLLLQRVGFDSPYGEAIRALMAKDLPFFHLRYSENPPCRVALYTENKPSEEAGNPHFGVFLPYLMGSEWDDVHWQEKEEILCGRETDALVSFQSAYDIFGLRVQTGVYLDRETIDMVLTSRELLTQYILSTAENPDVDIENILFPGDIGDRAYVRYLINKAVSQIHIKNRWVSSEELLTKYLDDVIDSCYTYLHALMTQQQTLFMVCALWNAV